MARALPVPRAVSREGAGRFCSARPRKAKRASNRKLSDSRLARPGVTWGRTRTCPRLSHARGMPGSGTPKVREQVGLAAATISVCFGVLRSGLALEARTCGSPASVFRVSLLQNLVARLKRITLSSKDQTFCPHLDPWTARMGGLGCILKPSKWFVSDMYCTDSTVYLRFSLSLSSGE